MWVESTARSVLSSRFAGLYAWQWVVVQTSAPTSGCRCAVAAKLLAATAWAASESYGQEAPTSVGTTPFRYSSMSMVSTVPSGIRTLMVSGTAAWPVLNASTVDVALSDRPERGVARPATLANADRNSN